MAYHLTLRPKSTGPVCKSTLHEKLLAAGLQAHPDSGTPEMLADGFALFEIIAQPECPAGVSVRVKIPYGRELFDLTLGLLNLERLARVIGADMLDGDEVMVHSGQAGLVALFAFHARYERAAKAAAASPGVA